MKTARDIIADAIRPGMMKPVRAFEAAEVVIDALTSAGFVIVRRRSSDSVTVDLPPPTDHDEYKGGIPWRRKWHRRLFVKQD